VLITWLTTTEQPPHAAGGDDQILDAGAGHRIEAGGRFIEEAAGGLASDWLGSSIRARAKAQPVFFCMPPLKLSGSLSFDAEQTQASRASEPWRESAFRQPAVAIEQKADVLPTVSERARAGFWKHQGAHRAGGLVRCAGSAGRFR